MAEPRADRIEIDTGLEQVAGARVAHDMRCDRPVGQRRHTRRASLDEPIDSEPGIGPAMAADEDVVAVCGSVNELAKGVLGAWPQRTLTGLASLSPEGNERMGAITPAEFEVADLQPYRLRDARPGVVQEQQQRVFGSASRRAAVRNRKQSLHLVPGDPRDRTRHGFLCCNGADLRTPVEMGRVAAGDKASEGPDRRQALVAGLHRAGAFLLEVDKELKHPRGCEIGHGQPVHRLAGLGADERQQQGKAVAVALLGVAGEPALGDDVVGQEAS